MAHRFTKMSTSLMRNLNLRAYMWVALAALLFYDYQLWQRDYPPPNAPAAALTGGATNTPAPASALGNRIPEATAAPAGGTPAAAAASAAATTAGIAPATPAASAGAPAVHVRTDVLDVDISTRGGTLTRVDLPGYPKVKGEAAPVRLENQDDPASLYELQSGLTGPAGAAYPTHLATYTSAQPDYTLGGAQELRVPLTWSENGVTVTKTFVFRRGQYRIDLDYAVVNGSSAAWAARPYLQILRNDPPTKRSYFNVASNAFHGPAIYDGTGYHKLEVGDEKDAHMSQDVRDGWIAALQHHFVSAIVPPRNVPWHFALGVAGRAVPALGHRAAHQRGTRGERGFQRDAVRRSEAAGAAGHHRAGAGARDRLRSPHILAQPLFRALSFVHRLTGNWGVSIIMVTLLLKLLFYPLSEASGRSMAKMKTLQPRIKNLQDTYADDREKLGRAMMELYKREKINPVAGCLPIVIQIPVFLAFYWVLLESVEMRQAPFAFWIHDLSARDPLFILPAIMAVAMFVQYKLNPAPPDPVQAKVFMIMPLVMSVTFAFFPAGLVLYWVTNTILSIAQQWNINRRISVSMAARK